MTSIIIILTAIAAAVVIFIYLRNRRISTIEKRVFAITDKRRTPSGVTVWVENGVAVTTNQIDYIRAGLMKSFIKAGCKGYTRAMTSSDYIIAIVKGEPDSNGDPCYRLPAGQYAGTEYDKGGYILVAGQMIAVGDPDGNIIAIPEHFAGQDTHLSLVAEFEAEHVILAWNDGDEFERTKSHGSGNGHPIIPNCTPDTFAATAPPTGYFCG